jgi:type I restriction enzyme S subunit
VINQALLKLRTDDKLFDSDFFYHYFGWDPFQRQIIDNTHGGAMQNLVGMDSFKSVAFPRPPIAEQTAIAEVLTEMDAELAAWSSGARENPRGEAGYDAGITYR